MNIAENLNRIVQAKSDIKTAIENKGVFVGDVTIDHYADKIDMISGAAGDEKIKLYDGICLSGSTWSTFDMGRYDWSNVHDWGSMFEGCDNLKTLENIPKNTMTVSMEKMFRDCSKLESIDLSSWDTSNVTDMGYMFWGCVKLLEVRMYGDVSKVTNVLGMFNLIAANGTFYYNPQYDYSKIIAVLPSSWAAVPME